jgi:hypothetical protein
VNATLDSSRHTTFEGTFTGTPEDAGSKQCALVRSDTTDATLDSTTDTRSLSGTIDFLYSVLSGYDCSGELTSNGGGWTQFPCKITYSFTGARN